MQALSVDALIFTCMQRVAYDEELNKPAIAYRDLTSLLQRRLVSLGHSRTICTLRLFHIQVYGAWSGDHSRLQDMEASKKML